MNDTATRLAPTKDTLRALFLKSGNMCAYPGCTDLMMNADGIFIGNLCHIEAAEKGGKRFNASMSNDQRRAPSNLMLMCYPHHKETDDEGKFPVLVLQKFKADHEARFSSPDRAILATLKDWTTSATPTAPQNMRRCNRVLGWNHSGEELSATLTVLTAYIKRLEVIPMGVRSFLGKVIARAHRVRDTAAVSEDPLSGLLISCFDLESAFQRDASFIKRQVAELATYGLGGVSQIMIEDDRPVPAVLIHALDGWQFWVDVAEFSARDGVPMEAFTEELDFSSFDE